MLNVTYEQLVDLAEGLLPADEAATLRRQIAADPTADAELAAIEQLLGLMRSDASVDAPDHVINRALRLMRRPAPQPAPGMLQHIIAVLRSDSRQRPLAAGLRSSAAVARNLAYSAERWDLDLQLTPRGNRWQLRGQLLGEDLHGTAALHGGDEPLTAPINASGEFSLPPVAAGNYQLLIRLGTHEILVELPELER